MCSSDLTVEQLIKEKNFSQEMEATVIEWLEYKVEKRQGYKPTGLKNLISTIATKAASAGDAPVIALIHECMANNWQGIIWDRLGRSVYAAPVQPRKSTFNNFPQREYNWAELERQLLSSQGIGGDGK